MVRGQTYISDEQFNSFINRSSGFIKISRSCFI